MKIGEYTKSLVALLITALTTLQSYLDDKIVTTEEWQTIGALVVATVAAWLLPNLRPDPPAQPAPSTDPWSPENERFLTRPDMPPVGGGAGSQGTT
jgi:hypothetical protein